MAEQDHIHRRVYSNLSRAEKKAMLVELLKKRAKQLIGRGSIGTRHSFVDDTELDASIHPIGASVYDKAPRAILLTGATGFLGAHLLHDLCRQSPAQVYALVRASNVTDARSRIDENAVRYDIPLSDPVRVVPILGDISKPKLGLSDSDHTRLATEVDTIYHNAAHVQHVFAYERLRDCNVGSTIEILKLAVRMKTKHVHYISSLVASVDRDSEGYLLERFPAADPSELTGGYAQTKWVSEKLLGEAHQRGIPVSVFRAGHLSGRSDTGAWQAQQDHLLATIKGCIQMGTAPEGDTVIEITPIDFVSEAITRISLEQRESGLVVNLCNPHSVAWSKLMEWVNALGYSVRMLPLQVWQEQLPNTLKEGNALLPLLSLYMNDAALDQRKLLLGKLDKVRCDTALKMLGSHHMRYPEINLELWRTYFQHLRKTGFLDN